MDLPCWVGFGREPPGGLGTPLVFLLLFSRDFLLLKFTLFLVYMLSLYISDSLFTPSFSLFSVNLSISISNFLSHAPPPPTDPSLSTSSASDSLRRRPFPPPATLWSDISVPDPFLPPRKTKSFPDSRSLPFFLTFPVVVPHGALGPYPTYPLDSLVSFS